MKQPFEQWNTSLWNIALRTIWIGVAIAACIGALRLMAWADKDMRGKSETIEQPTK